MEEIYKVIVDFPITLNLRLKNFSEQASTMVALTYEAGRAIARIDSGMIQKCSDKTTRYVWVIRLNRIITLQNIPAEDCILVV